MAFARDRLSVRYDGQVAAYLSRRVQVPVNVLASLPGGGDTGTIVVASPPAAPGDGVPGSDLTVNERAWWRSAYRWMDANYHGVLSLRVRWGQRTAAGRVAFVTVFPYQPRPAPAGAQTRRAMVAADPSIAAAAPPATAGQRF